MSTDFFLACWDCKTKVMVASSSGFYGFKVWGDGEMLKWLGHGEAIGHHEWHDVRLVNEHYELPWEDEFGISPTYKSPAIDKAGGE